MFLPGLAAKDRNLHPVAILDSTARTTWWTGTESEKNAQWTTCLIATPAMHDGRSRALHSNV